MEIQRSLAKELLMKLLACASFLIMMLGARFISLQTIMSGSLQPVKTHDRVDMQVEFVMDLKYQ